MHATTHTGAPLHVYQKSTILLMSVVRSRKGESEENASGTQGTAGQIAGLCLGRVQTLQGGAGCSCTPVPATIEARAKAELVEQAEK